MISKQLLLYIIVLLQVACSNNKNNIEGSAGLRNIDSVIFKMDDGNILGFVGAVKVSEENDFILHDIMQQKLFVFDSIGALTNTIGEPGAGPDEFEQILSFDVFNDTVVVLDEALDKFKLFRLNGEYISTIEGVKKDGFFEVSHDLEFEAGKIYVPIISAKTFTDPTGSPLIASYNLESVLNSTIGEYPPSLTEAKYYDFSPIVAYDGSNNLFYTSHLNDYTIRVYDRNGELQNEIINPSVNIRQIENKIFPSYNRRESMESLNTISLPRRILLTDNHILYYFINKTENGKDHLFLSIFDKTQGSHLGDIHIYNPPLAAFDNKILFEKSRNPNNYTLYIHEIMEY